MKYIHILFLALALFLSTNCHKKELNQEVERVINTINNDNVSTFNNILISTRGRDEDSNSFIIASFTFFTQQGEEIILLPHNKQTTLSYLYKQGYIDRIFRFSEVHGVNKDEAISFYIAYSQKVVNLFNQLDLPEVFNKPSLGSFTVFRINEDFDLVYLKDSNQITSEHWKTFFSTNQSYRNNWYLKRRN